MLLCLHGMQSFRPGLLHHTVAADSHMVTALSHALVLLNICTAQQAWSCCQAVTFVWYQAFEAGVCTEGACVSSKHASENKQDCANNSVFVYLQCCFMGQVYRHAMRIHNRGSSAMKATLSLPPSVHPFLQAQPTTGFCQVCSSQNTCHTQQQLQTMTSGQKVVL